MKFIFALNSHRDLSFLKESGVCEVLLGCKDLARFGEFSLAETQDLARSARKLGLRSVLVFDILMTETLFWQKIEILKEIDLSLFDAVRVQDQGALTYLQRHSELPLQLVIETGNHNTIGVETWAQIVGDRLERLVLSLEWPKRELFKLLSTKKLPIEIMGLGPILLFYSPRSLVRPLMGSEEGEYEEKQIALEAASEESPHKGFRVLENSHGTFMFHPKHHGLLDEVQALKAAGLAAFRLELTDDCPFGITALFGELIAREEAQGQEEEKIKALYPHALIKGFYQANKSKVLFKKLKNQRLCGRDENLVGVVCDYKKGRALAVHNLHPTRSVCVGENFRFLSTEGKERFLRLLRLHNLSGESIEALAPGKIGLFPHVGSMSVKSQVFWQDESDNLIETDTNSPV